MLLKIFAIFCILNVTNGGVTSAKSINYFEIMSAYNKIMQMMHISSASLNVSSECATQWNYLFDTLFKDEPDEWALKMLDATSKVQSGLLAGNIYNLGDYDECQSIYHVPVLNVTNNGSLQENEQETISGKYCLGTIETQMKAVSTDKLSFYWAMCIPEKCSADDLNTIVKIANLSITFAENLCHAKSEDPKITGGDVALIVFILTIVLIMITSSSYDVYLYYAGKEAMHPSLVAFSVITNGKKIFLMGHKNKDQLNCLDGIRAISMMWIIQVHSASNTLLVGLTRMTDLMDFFHSHWTMYLRGATVSVDSFFLMSGIVTIYVYMKAHRELRLLSTFQFYFHRYLRLTPALAVMVAVNATLIKHMGGGPFWYTHIQYSIDNCATYWWSSLLYIQNFVNPYKLCIVPTWYLSVDTQLFFISPLILIPIKKWPRTTLLMSLFAAVLSVSSAFAVAWIYELVDFNSVHTAEDSMKEFMTHYYSATYARASPWLIGVIVGYFIYKVKITKMQFKIKKIFNIILWICSLSLLLTCVFYDKFFDDYDRMSVSLYLAFARPVWAIALSWIIFACVTGYGGPVNAFLSLPVFKIVSRLTYSMFITHFTIILVRVLSTKQTLQFGSQVLMYNFWSTFALVFAISTIWSLAFESPIIALENILLKSRRRRAQKLIEVRNSPPANSLTRLSGNGHINSKISIKNDRNVEETNNGIANQGFMNSSKEFADSSLTRVNISARSSDKDLKLT